jgi:hypothetical protein
MNQLISGMRGIELQLVPGTSKYYFPDIPDLRNKPIKHILFMQNLTCPSGNTVLGIIQGAYITFREQNTQNELIEKLPINALFSTGSMLFINKIIDFQHSFIEVSDAIPASKSLFYIVMFDEPKEWNFMNENEKTSIVPFEISLTQNKNYFPRLDLVKNQKVRNILLSFPVITPLGFNGINPAYIHNKYITLSDGHYEFISKIPIEIFVQMNQDQQLRFQNIKFDPQTSYVETVTTTANDLKALFFNAILTKN